MSRVDRCFGIIITITALASAACGGDAPNADERAPRWTAEPVVRAGAVDGPGFLTEILRVAVGPDDRIFVAQPSPPTISVFDADGRFFRTVGRAGPGPGDLGTLGAIGWTGDTLWAMDLGRVHLFDRDLEFVRTIVPAMPDPRLDSDTLVDRVHAYTPIPIDDPLRNRTYRERAEAMVGPGDASVAEVADAIRAALPAPAFLPPVTDLVAGRDGTIWLRREGLRQDTADWDI